MPRSSLLPAAMFLLLAAPGHGQAPPVSSAERFNLARNLQSQQSAPPDIARAAAIYRELLQRPGDPYVRRAQFELGNLVLDGRYSSGDPRLDLAWARLIAQELLGQEQIRLAFATGSVMDLPESPEVTALTVRTAASYAIDMAERAMAGRVPAPERIAWLRLAGQSFDSLRAEAETADEGQSSAQRYTMAEAYAALLATRAATGALYRAGDPLLDPGQTALEAHLREGTDADAQLRLAFYYEQQAADPSLRGKAMDLYRTVRDGRVSSVRFRIGTLYATGADAFPRDPVRAAQWFGFAAKAGSVEACDRINRLKESAAISPQQAEASMAGCPSTPPGRSPESQQKRTPAE